MQGSALTLLRSSALAAFVACSTDSDETRLTPADLPRTEVERIKREGAAAGVAHCDNCGAILVPSS